MALIEVRIVVGENCLLAFEGFRKVRTPNSINVVPVALQGFVAYKDPVLATLWSSFIVYRRLENREDLSSAFSVDCQLTSKKIRAESHRYIACGNVVHTVPSAAGTPVVTAHLGTSYPVSSSSTKAWRVDRSSQASSSCEYSFQKRSQSQDDVATP